MKTKILILIVISVFLLIVVSACASTPTQAPTSAATSASTSGTTGALDGATIMQAACTGCHGLSAIYNTQTDEAGWTTIVDNMIQRGAKLTPEEKTVLIQYLAANY